MTLKCVGRKGIQNDNQPEEEQVSGSARKV